MEEIFKAFTQTRAGALAGGSGLGLTISQHLIRRMGDRLRVESTPGHGSRFYFALPLVLGPASASGAPEAARPIDARLAPGECVTALVVDDSTVSRRILASLLESAGAQVITAAGGLEALELAPRHRPDIIFMDLRMADVDGFTATRRLKQNPATAAIPVIAVTASAFGDAREAAREAGCADYLPKPVRAEALFAALQTHLGVAFVTQGDRPPAEPESARIGDDNQRAAISTRLVAALDIGNVTELDDLARELAGLGEAEAAVAARIGALAADFDFDGLRALAAELAPAADRH
jgi:CheY-like chemotaxis protein